MTRRRGLRVLAGLLLGAGLLVGLFNKVYVVELGGSTSCGSLFLQEDAFSKDMDNLTEAVEGAGANGVDPLDVTNFSQHCGEALDEQKPVVYGLLLLGLVGLMLSFVIPPDERVANQLGSGGQTLDTSAPSSAAGSRAERPERHRTRTIAALVATALTVAIGVVVVMLATRDTAETGSVTDSTTPSAIPELNAIPLSATAVQSSIASYVTSKGLSASETSCGERGRAPGHFAEVQPNQYECSVNVVVPEDKSSETIYALCDEPKAAGNLSCEFHQGPPWTDNSARLVQILNQP